MSSIVKKNIHFALIADTLADIILIKKDEKEAQK